MIPSTFVFLDKLPTAPNGKVHRAFLPAPGNQRPRLDTPFVSPGPPVEKALAVIWREVLSIDQVGVNDHFMDLGGNSLLAAQVISRVIQEFRVELPLRSLMEAPTIADMALLITENRGKDMDPADLERILQELEDLQTRE
jgi:acyl carrier protein